MKQSKKENTKYFKQPLFLSITLLLCFGAYSISCTTLKEPVYFESHEINQKMLSEASELQKENTQRAQDLYYELYDEFEYDIANTPDDPSDDVTLGAQYGYHGEPGTEEEYDVLVRYGRVWVYDAGVGLSLAVQKDDPSANERALWVLTNSRYISNPQNPEKKIFAGWPFSMNQAHRGDNWMDRRFVTGANTFALIGMAEYITSDFFIELDKEEQRKFRDFFADAIQGILYHFETKGPNEGLVTAGWSLNVLDQHTSTKYTYYELLDLLGYGTETIEGYPEKIRRTRSLNVVTEHCNDVLKLLNFTLKHYDKLFESGNTPYSYKALNKIRLKLRDSMLDKLYNEQDRRMITGRTAAGIPSKFTAIDNSSWLLLSLQLEELKSEQIEKLADSLLYTIANFIADFDIDGKTYFGTHYFPDGFEDPYIVKSSSYSSSYHMEATCGLICGLLKFAEAFPNYPDSAFFHDVATKLWVDMQYFIKDVGFIYASSSEEGTFDTKEASISAIWYLMTLKYFE